MTPPEAGGRTFELLSELGAGTFGTVYLANLVSGSGFRKRVAIKLLNPRWEDSSEWGSRLRDEARMLGQLQHRHIIQVDDLVRLEGRWAMVMEHVPGRDLEGVVEMLRAREEPFPLRAALDIVAAVTGALDAAYNGRGTGSEPLRVIHRDIKPGNVRITPQGDVKVLDFGIARAEFEGRESATTDNRMGTLGYMAPERFAGGEDTPASDIFAVGAMTAELLLGTPTGRAPVLPKEYAAWWADIAQRLQQARPEAPEGVHALVQKMMAYDVDHRPSATDVHAEARALARAAGDEDIVDFARNELHDIETDVFTDEPRVIREQTGNPAPATRFSEQSWSDAPPNTTLAPMDMDDAEPSAAARPRNRGISPLWIGGGALIVVLVAAILWPTEQPSPNAPEAPPAAPSDAPPPQVVAPPEPPPEAQPQPEAQPEPTEQAAVADIPAEPAEPEASAPPPDRPSATTAPVTREPAPQPEEATILRRVQFVVAGASEVRAQCGDVSRTGSSSVPLAQAPAGPCQVTATIDGAQYSATVNVTKVGQIDCARVGGSLSCS